MQKARRVHIIRAPQVAAGAGVVAALGVARLVGGQVFFEVAEGQLANLGVASGIPVSALAFAGFRFYLAILDEWLAATDAHKARPAYFDNPGAFWPFFWSIWRDPFK